jgi:hypothetical protein
MEMSPLHREDSEALGQVLYSAGFRPLPDVNEHGVLIGTRLWRVCGDYVEYVDLRADGFAHAVRAEARFDYRCPTGHGCIIDQRSGYAVNAVDWLLITSTSASSEYRPYVQQIIADQTDWPARDTDAT